MNTAQSRTSSNPMHISRLGVLACVIAGCMAAPVHAQSYLPAIGGPGGGQFDAPCPSKQVLTGLRLRAGDDVDAVQPICAVPSSATQVEPQPASNVWHGGGGGGPTQVACPADTPAVLAMTIGAEGEKTIIVNDVWLFCGRVSAQPQEVPQYPTAIFDAPTISGVKSMLPNLNPLPIGIPLPLPKLEQQRNGHFRAASYQCPPGQVGIGVHGRSGVWLDAVGLICGAAPTSAQPPGRINTVPGNAGKHPVSLGRAKSTRPAIAAPIASRATRDTVLMARTQTQNDPPICSAARSAKEHKSPAAPGLERQCAAARATAASAAPPPATGPTPAESPAYNNKFMSPTFADGARLWACSDAADAEANDGACLGLKAGNAYCRMQGFSGVHAAVDGALGVTVKRAQAGATTRAINGDTCTTNACMAISELDCAP